MRFGKIERQKVADQIAKSIRDAIVGGSLEPGQSLPAERKLADRFGVNRSSIREALHRLEAWGLVETKHGEGTQVTNFLATAGLHILPYLLAPGGQIDAAFFQDLMDIRVMLLKWTAEKATDKATSTDIAALEKVIEQLSEAKTINEKQRLDYVFFETLVAITHNRVLLLLSNAVRTVYLSNNVLFTELYTDRCFNLNQHKILIKAMKSGDKVKAGEAMQTFGEMAFLVGSKGDNTMEESQ